jgi:hypothetical protein
MRTGKGGAYLLAVMVFSACLLSSSVMSYAQDQNLYVTPGKDSTAKPLFLQKLFGGSGSNSGLGAGKPYDFSRPARIERGEERPYADFQAEMDAQSMASLKADQAKQQKAIDQMYAEEAKRQEDETKKRLQQIAQIQRPVFPPNMPHVNKAAQPPPPNGDRRSRREARRTGRALGSSNRSAPAATQIERPMIYNKQKAEKNAHPPIFLQQ